MINTWYDTLNNYDYDVIHHPGYRNVVPDVLSRIYFGRVWGSIDVPYFADVQQFPKNSSKVSRSFKFAKMGEEVGRSKVADKDEAGSLEAGSRWDETCEDYE